jgi:CRISPR-associated endonuclease Cas1
LRPADDTAGTFHPERRNRRPPTDPVNAVLSFLYAMLVRTWTVALSAVGLDPYRGFYHQPRYGRPALALDMMEPFRPLLADSVALQLVNTGELKANSFVARAGAVNLKPPARKAVVAAYERRLDQEITHPVFGYRVSYRRLMEVQARLLGRHLLGEIDQFPHITPR